MMKSKIFTPSQISRMTDAQIRKEYSNLRKIANKRIQRLTAQNLGRSSATFPIIAKVMESTKSTVASMLADVSRFLRSDRTTVRGEKRFISDFREQMESKGYGDLVQTTQDVYNMIDFMETMREQYSDKIFDSGDALDVMKEAQRLKIPNDKVIKYFDEFASHLSDLEKVKPSRNGSEFSQRRIRNLIKKWEK